VKSIEQQYAEGVILRDKFLVGDVTALKPPETFKNALDWLEAWMAFSIEVDLIKRQLAL